MPLGLHWHRSFRLGRPLYHPASFFFLPKTSHSSQSERKLLLPRVNEPPAGLCPSEGYHARGQTAAPSANSGMCPMLPKVGGPFGMFTQVHCTLALPIFKGTMVRGIPSFRCYSAIPHATLPFPNSLSSSHN